MHKKVKNLYLRKGDHQFILQASFIYKAKQQNWNRAEIEDVIRKTLYKDKMSVYEILIQYVENK